jgi:hypothetical protein
MTLNSFTRVVQGFYYTTASFALNAFGNKKSIQFDDTIGRPIIQPPGYSYPCTTTEIKLGHPIEKTIDNNPAIRVVFHHMGCSETEETDFSFLTLNDQINIVNAALMLAEQHNPRK